MGMKTTVEISDPLFDEAKRAAHEAGVTLRELIEAGLRRVLDERKQRTKPFKLRDASVKGTIRPGVRLDDARAVRAYSYMGTMGFPDTVEAINRMLDEDSDKVDR